MRRWPFCTVRIDQQSVCRCDRRVSEKFPQETFTRVQHLRITRRLPGRRTEQRDLSSAFEARCPAIQPACAPALEILMRLLVHGLSCRAFSTRTLPPTKKNDYLAR